MSGGHYTPAGFAKTSDGTPGQAQLDDNGNLKVSVVAGGVGGGVMTVNDGGDVAEGTTTDPAWVSGAGTVISLLKKIASAGGSAVSIANGADVAEGTTTDVAITSDSDGTVIGFLRGLVKIFANVYETSVGRLRVQSSIASDAYNAAQVLYSSVNTISAAGGSVSINIYGPTYTYVEVSGTYTGATLAFTYERLNSGSPLVESVLGQRVDTGVAESSATLTNNSKRTWLFTTGVADYNGAALGTGLGPVTIRITAPTLTSGTIGVNATSYGATTPAIGATTILGALPLPTGAATEATAFASLDWLSGANGPIVTFDSTIAGDSAIVGSVTANALSIQGQTGMKPVTVASATATSLKAQAETYQGGTAVGAANPLQVSLANTGTNATAVKVDGSAVTQPVSVATLPLPTGASTSTLQTAGNISLSNIDSHVLAPAVSTTGTVTAVSSTLVLAVTGYNAVTGVLTTNPDLQSFAVEGTNDGTNWVGLQPEVFGLAAAAGNPLPSATSGFSTDLATATVNFRVNVAGFTTVRVKKIAGTVPSTWVLVATTTPYTPTIQSTKLYGQSGKGVAVSNTTGSILVEAGSLWSNALVDASGTPAATVKAASTAAVAADTALVTRTVQLPTALAASGGLKIEGVASGVTVGVTEANSAAILTAVSTTPVDVFPNDGLGPNYASSALSQHLTQTIDGRLRVILDTQSRQALLQLDLLNQMLAVLKAMNFQLGNMTGADVSIGDFLNDTLN